MAKSPVKFIKPRPLNIGQVNTALKQSLKDAVGISKTLFEMSYKTWDKANQPQFITSDTTVVNGDLQVEYSTDSKVFNIVTNGAPPHPIDAKAGKFLTFRSGFKAKTTPGVLTSFSQPPPSGQWNELSHVDHPGIEARHFEDEVVKVLQPYLETKVSGSMEKL